MRDPIPDDDAARASGRVVEGAITLAKAEVRLALTELRVLFQKAAIAAGLLWTAVFVAHVAIALVCVSPLLVTIWDAPIVLLTIALSVGIGVVLGVVGALRMRAAFNRPGIAPKPDAHGISVSPQTMHREGT